MSGLVSGEGVGGGGVSSSPGPTGPTGGTGPTGPTGPTGSTNIAGTSGKLIKFTAATTGGDSIATESGSVITVAGSLQATGIDAASAADFPVGGTNAASITIDTTTGVITYKKGGTTSRTDTFGGAGADTRVHAAGTTSITDSWTQSASGAGGTRTVNGQQGKAGSVGGDLTWNVGDGGTPGTNASGNFNVGLGTPVGTTGGAMKFLTAAAGVIGTIGLNTSYFKIASGAAATGGLYIASTSILQLEGVTTVALTSTTDGVWIQPSTGIVSYYKGSSLGALLTIDPAAAQSLAMQARTGNGANNGMALTISAQAGQAQTGGSANNNGGAAVLAGGAAGTGGGGAAGTTGPVQLRTGATSVMVEATEVASGQRVVAVNRAVAITTTEMPANTGDLVMYVGNAATAPTANSVSGGILYSEAGAGKWRGTGGTVTTFGPADPHCPTCGRDFAHEWANDRTGEHLAICVPCMLTEMGRAGLNTAAFAFVHHLAE